MLKQIGRRVRKAISGNDIEKEKYTQFVQEKRKKLDGEIYSGNGAASDVAIKSMIETWVHEATLRDIDVDLVIVSREEYKNLRSIPAGVTIERAIRDFDEYEPPYSVSVKAVGDIDVVYSDVVDSLIVVDSSKL